MDSNISLRVQDGQQQLDILKHKTIVGGAYLDPQKPEQLNLYGFGEVAGPWSCHRFSKQKDCTVQFFSSPEAGIYEVSDYKNSQIQLKLSVQEGKKMKVYFQRQTGIGFLWDKVDTQVDFASFDIGIVGTIWSQLGEDLPYGSNDCEKAPNRIQICGFNHIEVNGSRKSKTYRADVTVSTLPPDAAPRLNTQMILTARSKKEICHQLYASVSGIVETSRAIGLLAMTGKDLTALVGGLEAKLQR